MSLESASIQAVPAGTPPYARSWQDHLQDALERAPGPTLLAYLCLWIVPILGLAALSWATGTLDPGTLPLFYVNLWSIAVLTLALIHFLDRSASAALERFQPALTATEAEVEILEYQLTRLPARKSLVAAVVGTGVGVGEVLTMPTDVIVTLNLFASPWTTWLEYLMFAFGWIFFATLVYHTFHQLDVVRRIYRDHTRVNLFRLDPIYSFSWLTARTAVGIALIPYWYHLTSTNLYGGEPQPEWYLGVIGIMLLGAILFVWPLMGIHAVLEREKTRLAREAAIRLEGAVEELHRAADAREYGNMDGLNKLISSLTMEQAAIEKISTWPWKPETLRLVVTALLLPLIAFVAQRVIAVTLNL